MDFLSWQGPVRARIENALSAQRLAHALLLQGPQGVGKAHFAAAMAAALLCTERGVHLQACGECADCQLTRAGSHPDLYWLQRPEERKSISVDQVRDLGASLAMTSMRTGYRVAIISPAEIMTVSAQNALLKTLEEPQPRTMLLLVSARPSRLLATLRSRCQRAEMPCPPNAPALEWLQSESSADIAAPLGRRLLAFTGGSPFRALALSPHFESLDRQMSGLLEALVSGSAEVTRAAEDMMGEGLPARLEWLEKWLESAVRMRTVGEVETGLTIPGGPSLQRRAAEVNISGAFRLMDRIRETRRLLDGSAAPQLLVEVLLLDFGVEFARGRMD
jgi:DNA polymerase-3 subunit delta'